MLFPTIVPNQMLNDVKCYFFFSSKISLEYKRSDSNLSFLSIHNALHRAVYFSSESGFLLTKFLNPCTVTDVEYFSAYSISILCTNRKNDKQMKIKSRSNKTFEK